MGKYVLLDNVTHKNLRIITERGENYGDSIGYATIVPREFRQAIADYPIVFRKNSAGQFESVVLLGFDQNENLFLNGGDWKADYIPLSIERIPFMIGHTVDSMSGQKKAMIHIDSESPRVNDQQGEQVFLAHGGTTKYLERINGILAELLNGVEQSLDFTQALTALELLDPLLLKIQLKPNISIEVNGFFTIGEEKLRYLNANALIDLHKNNFLELAYLSIASLSNIRKLIKMKEEKINNREVIDKTASKAHSPS